MSWKTLGMFMVLGFGVSGYLLANAETGTSQVAEVLKEPAIAAADRKEASHFIVYYFHGDQRCRTCKTIEAYAKETVETTFAEDIKQGKLEWKLVNLDETKNEHFVDDFQLAARTVVIAEKNGDSMKRFKTLDKVWEKVGDKEEFQKYVRDETSAFVAAKVQ